PSSDQVQSRIAEVEGRTESTERSDILSALQATRQNLEQLSEAEQARAGFVKTRDDAPRELAAARQGIATLENARAPDPLPAGVPALESLRDTIRAERDQFQVDLDRARQVSQQRSTRRGAIPTKLTERRAQLQKSIALPSPDAELPELRTALEWKQQTQIKLLETQIDALLEEERNLQDETIGQWRQAQIDLAQRQHDFADRRLQAVTEQLDRARREVVQDAQAEAAKRAADAKNDHPLIAMLTQWSADLARERASLTGRLAEREQQSRELKATRETLTRDVEDLRSRVQLAGRLSDSVGQVLRQKRRVFERELRNRRHFSRFGERLGELQLRGFELDRLTQSLSSDADSRTKLDAIEAFDASRWPDGTVPDGVDRGLEEIEGKLRTALTGLRDESQATRGVCDQLTEVLAQLIEESDKLTEQATDAKRLVDENVLWLRSTTPIWTARLGTTGAAYGWLVAGESWQSVVDALRADFGTSPVPLLLLGVFGIALVALGGWARRRLRAVGEEAAKGATATIAMTVWALLLTVVTTLPMPLVLLTLGYRLDVAAPADSFAAACSSGLTAVGWLALIGMFARRVAVPGGLADLHFRWPVGVTTSLRRNLAWALPIAAPWAWVLTTLRASGNEPWTQAGGRPALLVILVVIGLVLWRWLHPGTGVVAGLRAERAGVFARWGRLWFWIGIGTVVGLFALSLFGFQFTAVELTLRLLATLGLVFGLTIGHAVLTRGLVLARRDLAKARVAAEQDSDGGDAGSVDQAPQDLGTIGQQSRALVRGLFGILVLVGAWFLWVDVVPAFSVLREVDLWSETVDGVVVQITLASFLLASVYIAVTLIAARNVPGVLELTILKRFNIHHGERHAIKTIARYVILVIGFVSAFSAIGLGWAKVQWLVAALGVGLGFGLQEIFANFVSGIIILMERPIRVGDFVTVSDTDGTVSQIRMRATVVTTLDRKELVIPNKEFITGRVVNWSLSDPVLRIVFKIGVAYGTDAVRVRQVLLDVAKASKIVLAEPRPKAIFTGFGDSTLDFQLRVFIASIDDWPRLMNDINTRVQRAFAENDIEIAFPQRDLHVRTAPGLIAFAEQLGAAKPPQAS
ncbi:MAG: mechanosensitive ion channel, partial [Planctomycetes bacterium]|nr:mechanosensitive ion channel [Planctomycetota bacterium]